MIFIVYRGHLSVKNFHHVVHLYIIITPFFFLEHLVYCYINVHKNRILILIFVLEKNDYVNTYLSKSVLNENQ